jgi:CRISPR/Cas system-associated protein Cas10 (large subunit of type III CRISPR-Cas system)
MSANKVLLGLGLCVALTASSALGAVSAVSGELTPFEGAASFQETIEARCTICHTRERVDEAIRAQRDLAPLIEHMVERGAILSERDRKVLGTFWGSPLKGDGAPVR